ncbi:MAG: DMT family transporter [Dehalobacterium sp.]
MSNTAKGFLFAVLAGVCWGTFGTFVRFLIGYGFTETAISILGPALMVVFFLAKVLIQKPQSLKVDLRGLVIYILVGVIGVIGSTWCYAVGLSKGVPLAVASILTFLNYFLVMIVARILWNDKITSVKIFSGIATVVGIALILNVFGTLAASMTGLFWMGLVVISFAGGFLLCKYAVDLGYDYDAYLMYTNLFAIIVLSFLNPPWSVVGEITTNVHAHGFPAILALLGFGLIPMVGSYYFLLTAFGYLESALVVIMYSLDPVVAAILGLVIFRESLGILQVLGIIIVLAALAWLQLSERAQEKKLEEARLNPVNQIAD